MAIVACPFCSARQTISGKGEGTRYVCRNCRKVFEVTPTVHGSTPAPPPSVTDADRAIPITTASSPHIPVAPRARRIPKRFEPATSWLDLFDIHFRKYLTPWIVKLTWVLTLLFAFIVLGLVTIGFLGDLSRDVMPRSSPPDTAARSERLPRSLEMRSEPPSKGPGYRLQLPNSGAELRLLAYCAACFGIVLAVLWVRVLCESVIVVFNMAKSLSVMEDRLNR